MTRHECKKIYVLSGECLGLALAALLVASGCSSTASDASAGSASDAGADVEWPDGSGGDSDGDADAGSNPNPYDTCHPDTCQPRTCSLTREEATYNPADAGNGQPQSLQYYGHENYNASVTPPTSQGVLRVEIYPETSGTPVKLAPGEILLQDRETQYSTCGYCVRYLSNVLYDPDGGLSPSADIVYYMACDGTLSIDALDLDAGVDGGPVFDGRLSATFVEVTIDDNFISHPVANGDSFCVSDLHFHAPVGPFGGP